MLQFDANANAHTNVDASVNGPLVIHNVLLSCVTILPNPTLELKQTRGDSFIGLFKSLLSSKELIGTP